MEVSSYFIPFLIKSDPMAPKIASFVTEQKHFFLKNTYLVCVLRISHTFDNKEKH
jgi:hypothetical protein